jgi:hypothetical protein
MSETEKRICANCKWYRRFLWFKPECTHPQAYIFVNIVTGETRPASCANERYIPGRCGESGKNFEAKTDE